MINGRHIVKGRKAEVRKFAKANLAVPASTPSLDDQATWAIALDARTRVFLTLCAHNGDPGAALIEMAGMASFDAASGESFDMGDWGLLDPETDAPMRLYAGLLLDAKANAFHRLVLQSILSGVGASVAVRTLLEIMKDENAKASDRVAAARLTADMNGMLARVGVDQVEKKLQTIERATGIGGGLDALPGQEMLAQAEEEVARWRAVLAIAESGGSAPSDGTESDEEPKLWE